jgi:UDP:flavonoid glycosyltransferase YjiC (YdhE family)
MAHIVLTTWGSHGDLDPFLGLGAGLRARGHRVAIATIEYYKALVESYGLEFRPMGPHVAPADTALITRIMDPVRGSEFLLKDLLFPRIEAAFEDVDAAAHGAELLVSHPVSFATPIVAARRGIPWASAVLAPTSMFSTYDVPAIPPAPWIKGLERLGHWPGRLVVGVARRATATWAAPLVALRARLGLPQGGNPVFEGQHSPWLVLALYSRVLGSPQPDWPRHVIITGHILHDAPHGPALQDRLERFLSEGAAPIVFTLGSSVVLIADEFWRESLDAVARLGARAVLLAGPLKAPQLETALRERADLRERVVVVDRAPHSLLFPRAAAVVQHCGIGTLAQSLRSGRPMLAVPYSHDQPDNAWRARRLGMSRTVYPRQYRGRRVARELRRLVVDPGYTEAARRVAGMVRAEDGVRTACDAIEQTFRIRR